LEAKDGEIIDGIHREKADRSWKRIRLNNIDTEEKKLLARLIANFHRRIVPYQEKKDWINGLAKIYEKQGLKISLGPSHKNEIIERISNLTGLSSRTVRSYIHSEYLQDKETPIAEPKVPASQVIKTMADSRREGWGDRLIERHRQEIIAEEKPKIESKLKTELLKSPEFIREAIEKAPQVLPTLPKRTIERAKKLVEPKEMIVQEGVTYTVGEYECPHCKKHYLIKCDGKRDWVE
jgi:ribosomal protein S8